MCPALEPILGETKLTTKSYSLTPCPGLHVYKSHSPPRSSLAPKSALTGPRYAKRRYTEFLSKDHPKLVSASGESTRSSDAAPPFRPQDQQPSLEPATLIRTYTKGRDAGNPPSKLIKDHVTSSLAWRNQGYVTMPNTPSGPRSDDNARIENPSPSELAILSPHAIPTDLIDPHATWNRHPLMEDRNNGYGYEQALKPRRSIADKLSSMVERGWVGGDTFCKDDDEFAFHTTRSRFHIDDARRDRTSDSLSETSRPKKLPSYSRSLSVSTAELRSQSQGSSGQDALPLVKQKEPLILMNRESKKERHRQAKRSPPVDTTPRSSSDSGVHYLKTELANPTGKRRAWTLHHFRRLASDHSQIQQEASPTVWPRFARPNHHSREPDHESPTSTPHEGPIPKPGCEPTTFGDEQLHQNPESLSKWTGSRRSSSNAKESTRTASRSTSFFKRFPWYKVALVNKQLVVQDLLKEGQGNDETSKSTRAVQQDLTADQVGLSRGVSKSHTLAGCGHEVDENALKTETPPSQGPVNQHAMNARTSHYRVTSQSSLHLTTSPQEMNERQPLEQIQRALEGPQDSHVTSFKTTPEGLLGNPHQVVENVTEQTQSPSGMGLSGTQPRVRPHPGSIDTSFESAISGDSLRSFQARGSELRKEHSSMQPYAPSSADSIRRRADSQLEQDSFGSRTARAGEGFTASPDPCQQLRSKVVNVSPTRRETWTDLLPASVHRRDQDGPVHGEVEGKGKGIKKIQVIITFDGAEDLVIEAQLQNENGQEHWRTTA